MDKNNDVNKPIFPGSITANPMFDEDADSSMPEPEIPTKKDESGEYNSDFNSDIQWREDEENYSEPSQDIKDPEPADSSENEDKGGTVKLEELTKTGDRYAAGYQLLGKRPGDFKKKRKWLFKREESLIMRFVDKLVTRIYEKTKDGVLGHFFTSYAKVERGVKTSAILSLPGRASAFFEKRRTAKMKQETICDEIMGDTVAVVRDRSSIKRPLLKRITRAFEKSAFAGAIRKLLTTLFYLPMSTYGAALLSLGITTILVQAVMVFWLSGTLSMSGIVVGVLYTLIAVMTIFAGDSSLVRYLYESNVGSFLLTSVFGVSKKTVDFDKSVPKHRFGAFIVGVALGLLSALVEAHVIFTVALIVIVALGVAHNPESGVVITVFALPFVYLFENSDKYLCAAVFYITVVWILKILGGQRRARLGALEGWLALFALLIVVTGAVSVDTAEAARHATVMIASLLGFFIVAGLLSSRAWLGRAVNALILSGLAVSLLGIYEWIIKAAGASWEFEKILENKISSVFLSTDTLALYLVMVFFFALTGISAQEKRRARALSAFTMLASLVCVLLTMNIYAWVALVAVVMIYSLIKSKKSAASVFGLLVVILLAVSLVSDVLPNYLTGIAGNSFEEKISVLHVTMQMSGKYAISGIGLGQTVFENVYASLASNGTPTVSNGGSLAMEMMIRFGVMGVLFIAVAVILIYRQAFSTFKTVTVKKYASMWSIAALSALTAALLLSCVSYVWEDTALALLFWITAGLVSATRRLALFENTGMSDDNELSVSIPISSFRKSSKEPTEIK